MARKSLVSVVADDLLERIVSGEIGPNELVPTEQDLVATHEVSRMTVREALSALQAQNVIRVERGRGTFANPIREWTALEPVLRATAASMSDGRASEQLIELRRMIENGAIALAAANRTEDDLVRLDELLAQMRTAHEVNDVELFVAADIGMHDLWFRASGNLFIAVLLEPLDKVLYSSRKQTSEVPAIQANAIEHHGHILAAVRAGDPEAARLAMDAHMTQTAEDLRTYVVGNRAGR